jgi:hypothetical protein
MATITLYKDKINGVGSLLDDIIKSSNNLNAQLGTLKNTLQGVDSSTCNLQDTVDSISSSSKSEKDKVEDLKRLNSRLTEFIEMTTRRDASAKSEIERAKKDFYTKYSYLKPECEKSRMEKIVDAMKKACEWCKEHWKLLVTIVIVAVSIVLLCTGVGAILAGACWGAILGAVIGGVSGGLDSMARGGSFLDGFEEGAFSGAITGAITGAAFAGLGQLGAALGKGIKCASTLGKFVKGTAAVTKVMSMAMGGFDTIALLDKAFGTGDIAALNAKLHENKAYNLFQVGVTATAIFTGGMTTTMKCFVAGTLVLTANGLIAIEYIKSGDLVYAADEETLEVSSQPVLETYIRKTSNLIHITVNGENIISTFDHPYYVKGKGFVSAERLWIGAELIDNRGNTLRIEQIYRETLDNQSKTVYNFKVDKFHTYFVGGTSVLVHNADYNQSPKEIMAERTKDLDTQEHPSKYKQISAKEKARLEAKVQDRTITKEEYKTLEWNKKMSTKRQNGVNKFWEQERTRLQNGENGTRNWSPQQKADILNGKRPTYNGKTIQGHHSYSVSKYPHLADKGEVIYPATANEHLNGWHGGNYKNSLPGEPIKTILDF